MRAFDLQDTLLRINYNAPNIFEAIGAARKLYTPIGPFIVISAQPPSGRIRAAIRGKIETEFPNCTGVYFVSGSENQIVAAKARAIRNHNVTEFTDNDEQILTKLAALVSNVKLYKIRNGERTPFHG